MNNHGIDQEHVCGGTPDDLPAPRSREDYKRLQRVIFWAGGYRFPVIAFDGAAVEAEFEAVAPDMGEFFSRKTLPAAYGFYTWEGHIEGFPDGEGGFEVDWRGAFRPATRQDFEAMGVELP